MAVGAHEPLKKELGLFDVYCMATGTTLGAGLFLLPGLAAQTAGAALVIAYLMASIPLIPAMLSKVELATAMPRAGGTYYFLDRSLGPMIGTVGGLGTYLALVLKTAFGLIAMGAYLRLFFPDLVDCGVAATIALALGVLNVLGAKASGRFQVWVVVPLIAILFAFITASFTGVDPANLESVFTTDMKSLLATAGLVVVSYIGLTKVISMAEEVRDPERNLPLGVFLGIGTAIGIYTLASIVMVGVLGADRLAGDLTPVATTANAVMGYTGLVVMTVGALLASMSISNAGIASAARYPLAMSRDALLPRGVFKLDARGVPSVSIAVTTGLVVLMVGVFDPMGIAKLAGAFQLMVFALLNVAVIVMRESHIASYDPGYRSPAYPWIQIVGAVTPLVLIAAMGAMPIAFGAAVTAGSIAWYLAYARKRVKRAGAILHVFERLGRERFEGLDSELRGILKEKGLRHQDRFEEVVAHARVLDLSADVSFQQVVELASEALATRLGLPAERLVQGFLDGTRVGMTPVEHGVAIPHLRLPGIEAPELVVVRTLRGLDPATIASEYAEAEQRPIYAMFFLVSPEGDASQHLRFLAQLAVRVEESGFMPAWMYARSSGALKAALLQSEHSIVLTLGTDSAVGGWIGQSLSELGLPRGCLVAAVQRGEQTLIPAGSTVLHRDDSVCIIGDAEVVDGLRRAYAPPPDDPDPAG